jgi:hypothetical protein
MSSYERKTRFESQLSRINCQMGLIAGALKKKLGLDVISGKAERGRVYRIVGATKRAA